MKKLNAFAFLSLFAMIVFCSSKEASVKEFIVDTSENVSTQLGGDLDEHGCVVSGGYTWSEVLQDCIRLFEQGIRVEKIDGNGAAFLVFSGDSIRVELFFSDGRESEILEQYALPEGGCAWSATDDGTKNVQLIEGLWTISQRGRIIYRQQQSENDAALGRLQIRTYEGLLPCASCPGIRYTLTVRNREYSGDGSFWLLLTYLDAEQGEDRSFVYTGRRFTQRGMPNDNNATVWQLVADDGETIFNFLYEDEKTLIRLNDKFEKSDNNLNYSLKLSCELLSKVDIFDIRNNIRFLNNSFISVVNCSQKLISLIFGTTALDGKEPSFSCELLSKVDIFDIRNNTSTRR